MRHTGEFGLSACSIIVNCIATTRLRVISSSIDDTRVACYLLYVVLKINDPYFSFRGFILRTIYNESWLKMLENSSRLAPITVRVFNQQTFKHFSSGNTQDVTGSHARHRGLRSGARQSPRSSSAGISRQLILVLVFASLWFPAILREI